MAEESKEETRNHIRLQFPSQPRYVATIRDTIYRFCLQHGFSRAGAFDLKVIAGEALTNIIEHAYEGKGDRPIFIEMLFYKDYAEIRFKDLGKQVPITQDLVRDLGDYRESGLGLYLISQLCDYHFYDQSQKAGTTLIVKKRTG